MLGSLVALGLEAGHAQNGQALARRMQWIDGHQDAATVDDVLLLQQLPASQWRRLDTMQKGEWAMWLECMALEHGSILCTHHHANRQGPERCGGWW